MTLANSRVNTNLTQQYTLDNISVVMIETTLPANIGSAARAMWTMGLKNLIVVNPKYPIDNTSVAHAAGAKQILSDCTIVETLDDAIKDFQLIFAASSRQRHIPRPVVTPTQAAKIMFAPLKSEQTLSTCSQNSSLNSNHVFAKTAILFGREDRGLTNDELSVADYHIQINANPDYPVLNVASAVQVISSFIYSEYLAYLKPAKTENHIELNALSIDVLLRQTWDAPAITKHQQQNLQNKIVKLMFDLRLIESTDHNELRELPNRLSRLFSRLQLDQKEFELLNAIIAKLRLKL